MAVRLRRSKALFLLPRLPRSKRKVLRALSTVASAPNRSSDALSDFLAHAPAVATQAAPLPTSASHVGDDIFGTSPSSAADIFASTPAAAASSPSAAQSALVNKPPAEEEKHEEPDTFHCEESPLSSVDEKLRDALAALPSLFCGLPASRTKPIALVCKK